MSSNKRVFTLRLSDEVFDMIGILATRDHRSITNYIEEEVAQYMTSQLAYYRNYNDHGRILRLRRLCYALFDGRIVCTKSRAQVTAPTSA